MALDFQQVKDQVYQLGEQAQRRQGDLENLRLEAFNALEQYAFELDALREKVKRVARDIDANLRCAQPPDPDLVDMTALNEVHDVQVLPPLATILAADGSQIPMDRHAEVLYCLVNVGAIQLRLGKSDSPKILVRSRLLYDEAYFTSYGMITEATLALMRDVGERSILAELAQDLEPPVIAFTDGPVELWGGRGGEVDNFRQQQDDYLASLRKLHSLDATVGGYVDKPFSTLVVRLLEVAKTAEPELAKIKDTHRFAYVNDTHLFSRLLKPGQRSGVFSIQSRSSNQYQDILALHFFYLNVGREGRPSLARVEIPAWVAADNDKLNALHAVLVDQCRMMGSRRYPYLLHRAHETAVVNQEERLQVTQMIAQELRDRNLEVGEISPKQASKDLAGRTRY